MFMSKWQDLFVVGKKKKQQQQQEQDLPQQRKISEIEIY